MTVRAAIVRYPPGTLPSKLLPGDIGVVRDWYEDWLGELIQAGERADVGHTAYANLTHEFIITSANGTLVEANAPGIQVQNIAKYVGADFHIISPTVPQACRDYAVRFANAQVGAAYDFIDFFLGLAPAALFGWNLSVHEGTWFICSGLGARATECYTEHGYPKSPEQMKPANTALYWGVDLGEQPVALSVFAHCLDTLRTVCRLWAKIALWPARTAIGWIYRKIAGKP